MIQLYIIDKMSKCQFTPPIRFIFRTRIRIFQGEGTLSELRSRFFKTIG